MKMVLRLDVTGIPTNWLSREEAATLYTKSQVKWEFGKNSSVIFGGVDHLGNQSSIEMSPVIATNGKSVIKRHSNFSNLMLFRRDNHICMYCGNKFYKQDLTRDHVIPRSQGGKDVWENVVTACKRCNHTKGTSE